MISFAISVVRYKKLAMIGFCFVRPVVKFTCTVRILCRVAVLLDILKSVFPASLSNGKCLDPNHKGKNEPNAEAFGTASVQRCSTRERMPESTQAA